MSTQGEVRVAIVTRTPLGTRKGIEQILDALEAAGATPTHAELDDNPKAPYDRERFIGEVLARGIDQTASFARRTAPTYLGFFKATRAGLTYVSIAFEPVDGSEVPYRVGDGLAEALEVDFGYVHPVVKGAGKAWNGVANFKIKELQAFGPRGLTARTYLGPHLVGLFGARRLDGAPVEQRPLRGGGRVIDLAPSPWSQPIASLAARQAKATEHLAAAGVIGDYATFDEEAAGPGWKPFPESG